MNLGPQLKQLRKIKKISLTKLAKESGVQIATLSRIENGKMTGTLQSHMMIAKALGIELPDLYHGLEEDPSDPVISEESLQPISAPNEKVFKEILTRQSGSKKMLPTLIKIENRSKTDTEQYPIGSERFVFVTEGTIIVHTRATEIKLTTNSSLYFNASYPHCFENLSHNTAKFLSIMTPVTL